MCGEVNTLGLDILPESLQSAPCALQILRDSVDPFRRRAGSFLER